MSHENKALLSFSGNCPPEPESPTRMLCAPEVSLLILVPKDVP